MTVQPTPARKTLYNTCIVALINAGIWTKLDLLYLTAAHDEQASRVNLVSPGNFTALAVNSPTFVTDRGWTGDGATSRLRTQYTPSVNGVNWTQNDAGLWVWPTSDVSENKFDVGSTTGPAAAISTHNTSGQIQAGINDGSPGTSIGSGITDARTLAGITRVASGTKKAWRAGVQFGSSSAISSTGSASQEQWICAGDSSNFSTKQIGVAAWGASLTGLESQLYSALLAYMQGVGAA